MAVMIDLSGTEPTPDERALLAGEDVPGVCLFARNLRDPEAARDTVAAVRAAAGRDLLVAIDQEGGSVVRLHGVPCAPAAMALGAIDDVATTERLARATGRGVAAIGVNVDFAPVADVQSNPANPIVGDRAFGGDPELVARHVEAFVRGLQGAGVAATLKHFPGHGDVAIDSHLALPTLRASRERLRRLEWPPFARGIAAGAACVMTAHVVVPALDPDLPATLSRAALVGVLREELAFDGLVVTDALNMRAVADRWPMPEAAVLALEAGADLALSCGSVSDHRAVLAAVAAARREGRLDPIAAAAGHARLQRVARAFPAAGGGAPWPTPDETAAMADAAERAVTALGVLPRLVPGSPVAVVVVAGARGDGVSDAAAGPERAFLEALAEAGIPVRDGASATALDGAQALLVVSASRAPQSPEAFAPARRALAAARERALETVHVVLWNPVDAAALDAPALLTYGVRRPAPEAAVRALLRGEAPGRLPAPLTGGPGAGTGAV